MDLQVVILCGGQGTRMAPLTRAVPKPMVPVGEQPLLWHIMQSYARQGQRRFVLCLGYLGDVIRQWFADHPQAGWEVQLVDTGPETLTAGRLLRARSAMDGGPCFMTYGDGVSDVDLAALYARHRELSVDATVTALRPRSRFAVLDIEGGRVTRFREKPVLDQRVSGGFFVLEPAAFEHMGADEALEVGALGRLAEAGRLGAYAHDGFWFSVDTPRDLAELNAMAAQGRTPWLGSS